MDKSKTYWKDTMLVGVPQIDSQHRKLVEAIDRLMNACMQGKGRSVLDETLGYVVEYTKEHFRDEEKLQAQYSYPGMGEHKQVHSRFIASITAIEKELAETGPNIALIGQLHKALVDWLINHITTEDKKVGEHIRRTVHVVA